MSLSAVQTSPPPDRRQPLAAWSRLGLLAAVAVAAAVLWGTLAGPAASFALGGAAGLALALPLRHGLRVLPGVAAGLLLAQAFGGSSAWHALPPLLAALAAWCWLLRRRADGRLQRPRLAKVAAACLVLGTASGALLLMAPGPRAAGALPELLLMAGMVVGMLLTALPVLLWSGGEAWTGLAPSQRGICLGLAAASLACAALAAALPLPAAALALLCPVLLALLAERGGAGLGNAAALLTCAAGTWLLARGPSAARWAGGPDHDAFVTAWAALQLATPLLVGRLAHGRQTLERRWALALAGADFGVAEWDLRAGTSFLSHGWRTLLDDVEGELTRTPQRLMEQVHEDDRGRAQEALRGLRRAGGDSWHAELRLRRGSDWRWFELSVRVAARGRGDEPERLVARLADVSARRGADERQRLSTSLFQHLHEGLLITDAELRVLDLNPTYSQIMGVARQDVLGSIPALLSPAAGAAAQAQQSAMWASLRATDTWRGEMAQRRSNGEPCALQVTISAVRATDGELRYHVLVISDITEQRLQRERLERQAHFDELTRLPNRTRLSQMLAEAMAASDRDGYLLAVCYLDLDHFKPVNDRFGHAAGDRLLVDVAQRLRGALRSSAVWSDTAARLGGDEFVLLLRAGTLEEARLAVERVLSVIGQPFLIERDVEPVQISGSIGATVYPLDRSDADTLLRHADHAMYGAKQAGRNRFHFFDPEGSRRNEERVMAIGRVQEALDKHELVLHYQPKVDIRRGKVLGVEALLRWNHPEHGLIAPGQFLPLIEHTGLSAQIGDWVLEQAMEQQVHWQRMGLDLSVSVNVSARHLQEPHFAQRLAELLARHRHLPGSRLELEVLETAALADIDFTSALLERCRKLGVRFALDDFGTGYSTLTYLKRLPVDVLKVDRSFVHNMLDDRQDLAIVEGVIGLARTFGCTVVAEGVETPAQARMLIELGCDIGQGLGIAAAMPASEVFRWVRDYRGVFALVAAPAPAAPAQRAGPD